MRNWYIKTGGIVCHHIRTLANVGRAPPFRLQIACKYRVIAFRIM